MGLLPPELKRTDTLFPYTALFRVRPPAWRETSALGRRRGPDLPGGGRPTEVADQEGRARAEPAAVRGRGLARAPRRPSLRPAASRGGLGDHAEIPAGADRKSTRLNSSH